MGVREEIVLGDLGALTGEEALDEVGRFGVEAEAGEVLGKDVMVDEVEKTRDVEHEGSGLEASGPSIVDILGWG